MLEPLHGGGADLPLGQRDAALLEMYSGVRGAYIDALATCPTCGTTLAVQLSVVEMLTEYADGRERRATLDVDLGSLTVRARCPTTADLIAVSGQPDIGSARTALLARCVLAVTRSDGSTRPLEAGEEVRLGRKLEEVDPLVDVRIDVGCGECGHSWSALLDVPALVWAQVVGTARRLLREVDVLARRYGWSQTAILELSEQRRQAYLDLG